MGEQGVPPVEHRIKKGQIKNPKGKAKGTLNFKTIIKGMLALEIEQMNALTKKTEKLPVSDHMMAKLLSRAKAGNLQAVGMVMDRVNGKPQENKKSTVTMKGMDGLKDHQEETARRAFERMKAAENETIS